MRKLDRSAARLSVVSMAAAGLLATAAPAWAATFFVQQTNAGPGDPVDVCIWMTGGNNEVAGVQMDLTWNPACMVPAAGGNRPRCRSNPDTGKTVQSAPRGDATVRAIMLSFSDVDPIPDGELFCCQFRVTDNPPIGQCSVEFSNLIASTPTGQRTDARGGRGGAVNIARGGGAPPPVAGGYEPAPAPEPARPVYDDAPAPPAAGDDAQAAAPRGDADGPGDTGSAAPEGGVPGAGGAPGQMAGVGGQPGQPGSEAGGGDPGIAPAAPQARYAPGELDAAARAAADRPEPADAAAEAADVDEGAGAEATATPGTPTPDAAPAQATAARTPTKPAATPTQPQPTATPTVASGWLGGCTLMRR